MKKAKKIIYRFGIVTAIIVIAIFIFKQVLFSGWLRHKALNELKNTLNADTLIIAGAGIDFSRLYLNNIKVISGQLALDLAEVSAEYDLKDLLFSTSLGRRLGKIRFSGINLTIRHNASDTTTADFKTDLNQYQKIIRSLSDFSIINRLEIKDLNVDYTTGDTRISFLKSLHGQAEFSDDITLLSDFKGRFLDSERDNLILDSRIDCRYASAVFNFTVLPSALPAALRGDSLYRISSGTYAGRFSVEVNNHHSNRINSSGNMVVSNLGGRILDKVDLSDMEGRISFEDGRFSLNSLTGAIQGTRFSVIGDVNGLVRPEININLSIPAITPQLLKDLTALQQENRELRQLTISGQHSLFMHAYGKGDYAYDFRYSGSALVYQDKYMLQNLLCTGSINDNRVIIKNFACQTENSSLSASGEYHWAGSQKNLLTGEFKAAGGLLKEVPALQAVKAGALQADLKGSFRFEKNKWTAGARLSIDDRNKQPLLGGTFNIDGQKCLLELKNSEQQTALLGSYNLENGFYNLEGSQLAGSIDNFVELPDFIKAEKKLNFEIQGNTKNTHFRLGSSDSLSLLYGNLVGTTSWEHDSLTTLVSFEPAAGNRFPLPIRLTSVLSGQKTVFKNFYIDGYLIRGRAEYNLAENSFSGLFQADSIDLGRIKSNNQISTCTDFRMKMNGTATNPQVSLWLKEHRLLFSTTAADSTALRGELEAYLENNRIRLEKLLVFNKKQRLTAVSGYLEKDGRLNLSAYGRFKLPDLLCNYGVKDIGGNLEYHLAAGGSLTAPVLTNFDARINGLELLGEKFNNCMLVLKDNGQNSIGIDQFVLSSGDQLDLRLIGTLPYRLNDSLDIKGNFRCNLFKIAGKYVDFIKGSSINEGSFSLGGPLKKPRLSSLELYFLDGNVEIPGVFTPLSRFRGKAEMASDLKFRLIDLVAVTDAEDHRMVFRNYHGLADFEDVEIPGGINFGTLGLSFPDGGITGRAPYLMKTKDYGNFTLTGHQGGDFIVGKKYGILALSGKAYIRNLAFTYPFLDEKVFTTWQTLPGDTTESDYPGLYLDLEIIPASGVSYYYEGGTNEKSIWEKIKASFDPEKNRDINNVSININNQTKGLKITGNPLEVGQPVLSGEVRGRGGKFSYVAWTFDISEVMMRFDDIRDKNGDIDPYLSGTGKTRIRSRMDSTGYSGFEELFVKVVSKENSQITDYEGARFSKYFIEILDDEGNPWLTKIQENAKNIDTRATSLDLLNRGIDDRVLHPFMIPLERALADLFGLQFSLNPRVTKNISHENYFTENNKNYLGNLFEGSEVFITYPKDNFSLTLNSRYVGADVYAKDIQQDFGYQHNLSLDYYLGNYIYSSTGYRYNTLDKSYGYNLGLTYRYRFQTLETQFMQLHRWWHKVTE